jgi:hypothetical protein
MCCFCTRTRSFADSWCGDSKSQYSPVHALSVHAGDVEQRALGTRRPHDGHEIALLDLGVDAAEDKGLRQAVAVGLLDAVEFDHGCEQDLVIWESGELVM